MCFGLSGTFSVILVVLTIGKGEKTRMVCHGVAPFLECSSRGDQRFSAFFARPKYLNGRSIEEAYQAMKIFRDGSTNLSWRQAKGRKAINQKECSAAYEKWWREWVDEQQLLPILLSATGLSDMFGKHGNTCQATTLWKIRAENTGERNNV